MTSHELPGTPQMLYEKLALPGPEPRAPPLAWPRGARERSAAPAELSHGRSVCFHRLGKHNHIPEDPSLPHFQRIRFETDGFTALSVSLIPLLAEREAAVGRRRARRRGARRLWWRARFLRREGGWGFITWNSCKRNTISY